MAQGRSLRIFLVDGTPSGILTAEIGNWTGSLVVVPRPDLAGFAKRQEGRRTGVYCLVGEDPDSPGRSRIYVGEADSVLDRLTSHEKNKDFWEKAIVITSKDDGLTKAHGRYLESRLIQMTTQAGRAVLDNGTKPDTTFLPEADASDMEGFLEQVQLTLPVLGFDFLRPSQASALITQAKRSPLLVLTGKEGVLGELNATAQEVGDEFIVLNGSTGRMKGVPTWQSYKGLRDRLLAEGRMTPHPSNPNLTLFAEDIPFRSPSAAASCVFARATNGRTSWKVKDTGQTYQEWYEEQISSAVTTNQELADA